MIITNMVVNLHFQFGKSEPITFPADLGNMHRWKWGETCWVNDKVRRKIREAYKKAFHRKLTNTFTFHTGKGPNPEHNFNYNGRIQYRLVVPEGRQKHLWTNGRQVRRRVRNHRGNWRWRQEY